jgi:hypothetical protein
MPAWLPAVAILLTLGGMLAGFAAAWGSVRTIVREISDENKERREARVEEVRASEELRGEVKLLAQRLDSLEKRGS